MHLVPFFQAISAAISEAFSTPEILSLFAARQPDQLRERLSMVEEVDMRALLNYTVTPDKIYQLLVGLPTYLGVPFQIERDRKINKLAEDKYAQQKTEILSALIKLRAPLSPDEQEFLHKNASKDLAHFVGTEERPSECSQALTNIVGQPTVTAGWW